MVLTSRAAIAAQPEQASETSSPDDDRKRQQLEKLIGDLLKPTSIGLPRPQEVDAIVVALTWYRTQVRPIYFSMFVISHSDDIAWWLGPYGFRGSRFRRADYGRYVVDVNQTERDFDNAIEQRARKRAGQPVERVS
ncbi:hypothetical protein AB4144_43045, partial [Rhizobiaceae sp. 2RAB30]